MMTLPDLENLHYQTCRPTGKVSSTISSLTIKVSSESKTNDKEQPLDITWLTHKKLHAKQAVEFLTMVKIKLTTNTQLEKRNHKL